MSKQKSYHEKISILVPYYRNPKTLKYQLGRWRKFKKVFRVQIKFVIVDDGSPKPIRISEREKSDLDIKVYRINENIPWNVCGAKNLLVNRCETRWFLMHDIDHYMRRPSVEQMLSLKKDQDMVYHFSSRNKSHRSIITLFTTRKIFRDIGGYNEDFAGVRGNIDLELYKRMRRQKVPIIWTKKVRLHTVPRWVPDSTTTDWPRDFGITEPPVRTDKGNLRFTWERVC